MKIKVAHIITKLEMGGAQGNTIYTVENLNPEKFDTLLITGSGGILDEKILSSLKEKVIFSRYLKREISPLNDLKAIFEIRKILLKEKPDIVHTHSSKAGIIGRIAASTVGTKKVIHTFHGFGFNDNQNIFVKFFFIFLEKLCALISNKLVFVSYQNLKKAEELGIGKNFKYILIRSGVKLSDYRPTNDKTYLANFSIPEKSKIIISVGNLKPQKNPQDFYRIAKENIPLYSDLYFIYIGGGERLTDFREKAKKDGISSNCHFLGWRQDIKDILPACDFFLLTSLWEGLPRSLVEAMLCGLVPLCYKTDGIMDIIENGVNGFLFEKGDVNAINSVLKKLIEDNLYYKKIKENVLKTDLSEFDIELMVKKQEELYLKELFHFVKFSRNKKDKIMN